MFTDFFSVKLREQVKSEMGNVSNKLEAIRNSVTEDGGQFPKNEAKFIKFFSQANFNNVLKERNFQFYDFLIFL